MAEGKLSRARIPMNACYILARASGPAVQANEKARGKEPCGPPGVAPRGAAAGWAVRAGREPLKPLPFPPGFMCSACPTNGKAMPMDGMGFSCCHLRA